MKNPQKCYEKARKLMERSNDAIRCVALAEYLYELADEITARKAEDDDTLEHAALEAGR